MTIPSTLRLDMAKPVAEVLKNTLIMTEEYVQDIDFNELQFIQLPIKGSDQQVRIKVEAKANQDNKYKLESNQIFTLNRLSTKAALQIVGMTSFEFPKVKFNDVQEHLKTIGFLTKVKGDVTSEVGDATYLFSLTETPDADLKARFFDINDKDQLNKIFETLFFGSVELTFKGTVPEPEAPKEENKDDWLDLEKVFVNRNLGKIILSKSMNI
jgi:hypothetical protein|nr:MAG TPA: hypothetical protein [Caudoviricetes sp.]